MKNNTIPCSIFSRLAFFLYINQVFNLNEKEKFKMSFCRIATKIPCFLIVLMKTIIP